MISFELIVFTTFLAGLILGRLAYALVLIYEGRRKIYVYKCPSCKKFNGLFVFINWIFKQRKCSTCHRGTDAWLLIMELMMAIFFTVFFIVLSYQWFLLEALLFIFMSMVAVVVDAKRTILPDTLTLGGTLLALLGAWLSPDRSLSAALIGMLVGGGFLAIPSYIFYLIKKVEGVGGGDIKMMAWVGALVGTQASFQILLLSCVIATIVGAYLYLKNRQDAFMKIELAFGPYIAFSTYLYILLSESLILDSLQNKFIY